MMMFVSLRRLLCSGRRLIDDAHRLVKKTLNVISWPIIAVG
jgi:hypothetical protein